jgi:hypothetical protein
MMEYEFTLKFNLGVAQADTDSLVERLGEAGCDDALIGIGQPGRIALNFTRQAASAEEAVVSALRDVKHAIPDAKLVEASPDFVGLSDVAELVGVSRQYVRKLVLSNLDSFPNPVHGSGSGALWHLAPVLLWLRDRDAYRIDPSLFEVAHMAMQVNIAKDAGWLESGVRRQVEELVA